MPEIVDSLPSSYFELINASWSIKPVTLNNEVYGQLLKPILVGRGVWVHTVYQKTDMALSSTISCLCGTP